MTIEHQSRLKRVVYQNEMDRAELKRLRSAQDAALNKGDTPEAIRIGRDITALTRQMENPRG